MISHTSARFWDAYADLPDEVKRRAQKAYELFEEKPSSSQSPLEEGAH